MGIRLTNLEVETSGEIDLRGFLGIDAGVAAGYEALEQIVRIGADATPGQLRELHATVRATSPNFFNITRAIPTRSRLIIDGSARA